MKNSLYLSELELNRWFMRVFDKNKSILQYNKIYIADNLADAVEVWNNNFDKRCDEWEALRVQMIKNDEWLRYFQTIREDIIKDLELNSGCRRFLGILSEQFNINREQFFSELPGLGAWGEFLLGLKAGYHTNQICFYRDGFWVCGFSGDQLVLY